jgi:hypothetical protein
VEKEQAKLDFREEAQSVERKITTTISLTRPAYSEKKLRSSFFIVSLLFQVNSQRTGEK